MGRTCGGYFMMGKKAGFSRNADMGMHSGDYCNVIDSCNTTVKVDVNGTATITISAHADGGPRSRICAC